MTIDQPNENMNTNRKEPASWGYTALLWSLLLLVSGGVSLYNHYSITSAKSGVRNPSNGERVTPTITITGKYVMGAKAMYSMAGNAKTEELFNSLILQLKNYCRNKTDQTGIVPFIAELSGTEEVNGYIANLMGDPDLLKPLVVDLETFQKIYNQGPDSLTRNEQTRLIERHQWAGKLALAYGLSDKDPKRKEVMRPATRTFFIIILFMGGVSVLGLAGLVLFIVALVMGFTGKFSSGLLSHTIPGEYKRRYFLETTVIFLLVVSTINIFGRYMPWLLLWGSYIILTVLALFWPMIRGVDFKSMRAAFGWNTGRGIFREVGAGLIGYITGLPLIIAGCIITLMIIRYSGAQPIHPIIHQFSDAGFLKIAKLIFLACIMAPVLEETLFRGAFYRYLRFGHSIWVSAVISGLLFAVIHPQGYTTIPVLGAIGAVFALIREWRGSLIASMVAHALNNFMVTLIMIFTLAGKA